VNTYSFHFLFLGLKQGELTIQHLVQQLQNPAITRRHQELLLSILKTQSLRSGGEHAGEISFLH
jgi:hypothetical protein